MDAALDMPDGEGSSRRRRVEPRGEGSTQGTLLVLAAGLLAAAPVIAGVVRAIGFEWTATADDGQIAVRAFDVLSRHPPLLGQISLTSDLSGDPTFNLGPLEYWLLAIPARFGSNALLVTMGLVNTACVMGSVALARRRGGLGLMVAVAAGIAITLRSLPANAPYDLLNPYAALLPFTLLLFVAWSIACGDAFLLPVAAVAASFAVQCHLTYVVPVVGTLVLAVAGLMVSRHLHRSARRMRWWVLATAVVLLVCWSAPLAEQVTHRPGNLVLVARAAGADRRILGRHAGWHATARMVGVVPWWLRDPRPPFLRLVDLLGRPPALTIVSAPARACGSAPRSPSWRARSRWVGTPSA